MQKDYYSILGVDPAADQAAIKAAFRSQLKRHHPDLNQDEKTAAETKTREIIEAYRVLGNSSRRRQYDDKVKKQKEPPQDASTYTFEQKRKPAYFSAAMRAAAVVAIFFSILIVSTVFFNSKTAKTDYERIAFENKIQYAAEKSRVAAGETWPPPSLREKPHVYRLPDAALSRDPPEQRPAAALMPPASSIPIAQRAAILIEAPEDPQRVRTFVGSSIWRFDASGGRPALVADITLPDAKLAVSMRMMRNTDPKLPASHTIEFRFTPAPGPDPIGPAKIETPQMRIEDSANGAPLAGVPASILPNFFLVGLSNGDKLASRNMDLIRDRGWFDVPMVLSNGRIAKLTFEKGPSGEQALAKAIQHWQGLNIAENSDVGKRTTIPSTGTAPVRAMSAFPNPITVKTVPVGPDDKIIAPPDSADRSPQLPARQQTVERPLDTSAISELLDKSNPPGPPARPKSGDESAAKTKYDSDAVQKLLSHEAPSQKPPITDGGNKLPSPGLPTTATIRMAPSLMAKLDALMQERYKKCWIFRGKTATRYVPQIKVEYTPNGALANDLVLLNPSKEPELRSLAESALRAVRSCDPLPIPAQFAPYHQEWKTRILRFDPEEMAPSR